MRVFQTWWLKVCCFLTGYNFYILSNCSEVSTRKVKKYAAALVIVSTVWAFVGYCFCNTYMKLGPLGSIFGALIAVGMIVQIERQILLADKTNGWLRGTRMGLALLMAVIGSLVVDQIIFKDDIHKAKLKSNEKQVNDLMPDRSSQISEQIAQTNLAISAKEQERKELLDEISKHPNIQTIETLSAQIAVPKTTVDSSKTTITSSVMKNAVTRSIKTMRNPKFDQVKPLDDQLLILNKDKNLKENYLLNLRSQLQGEVKGMTGFLDELQIMISILKGSLIATIVYFIWFAFLLLLEMLILIGKSNDTESDYDRNIHKQMDIHFKKIELL